MNSVTFLCSVGLSLTIALSILGLSHINDDYRISADQNNVRKIVQEQNSQNVDLKILNHKLTKPIFSNWKVEGKIQNSGNSQIRYSVININFFDEKGNLLNLNSTKLNNLKPREIKDFEVEYKGKIDPTSYTIKTEAL